LPSNRVALAVLSSLFISGPLWSQKAPTTAPRGQHVTTATETGSAESELEAIEREPLPLTPRVNASDSGAYKQTPRMFWIVPNFAAVSANTEPPPLTPKGKFVLATHDSVDYSGFTWAAILAGQAMATRAVPELGTGMKGYARYYWRTFVDGVSGTYFTEAIVPVLTHEDPRYYTLGHGGFFRRFGYALSRTVVTKTDSEGLSFNWSEVGGNALEAALSNAYYPPQERGGGQTARDWGEQMESAVLDNIAKEFWPDIRHEIRHLILRHD
jgi:hypothetical protein